MTVKLFSSIKKRSLLSLETHPDPSLSLPLLPPFALLEKGAGETCLYINCQEKGVAFSREEVDALFERVSILQSRGMTIVGVWSYDLWRENKEKSSLKAIAQQNLQKEACAHPTPLFQIFAFETFRSLSREETDAWLKEQAHPFLLPGIADLQADQSFEEYDTSFAQIKNYLYSGDIYQVNLTFNLHFKSFGSPLDLYRVLRARQTVGYGGLIACSEDQWILSFSPELFVEKQGSHLTMRPMKGTIARLEDPEADRQQAHFLRQDEKNKAENVMIVDVLRNDLSRLSSVGSVKVPHLFSVEPYPTVWQMTSTITSEIKSASSLKELFWCLFPSGSVTGAPKQRAREVIEEQEKRSRGLYTGAFGTIDPYGNLRLSIAIRTLELGPPDTEGYRTGVLGIGSGIVLHSESQAEWKECHLKAKFLTDYDPGFGLIETMRVEKGQIPYKEAHLQRLQRSAQHFGFKYPNHLETVVQEYCLSLEKGTYRLRLELRHDGSFKMKAARFEPVIGSVFVAYASQRLPHRDPLRRHKTTHRPLYDQAVQQAQAQNCFDLIFLNEWGEVVEGARTSLFVKIKGEIYTPPLGCDPLEGIMRQEQITQGKAKERCLTPQDIERSEALFVANALHGLLPAVMQPRKR